MSNTATATAALPVLVSSREVLQKNHTAGERVYKVETYRLPDGSTNTVNFWYHANGKLSRIA